VLFQRAAIAHVTEQSLALAKLPDHDVTGDRPAAASVLNGDAFDAAQRQRCRLNANRRRLRRRLVTRFSGNAGQRLRDDEREAFAKPDVGEKLELALRAVLLLQRFPAVPADPL